MRYRLALIVSLAFLAMYQFGCEDPDSNTQDSQEHSGGEGVSTLSSESVGDGSSGYLDEYFYNFENTINVKFYKYDHVGFQYSYSEYVDFYSGNEPDTLRYKTYPEIILEFDSLDQTPGYLIVTPNSPDSLATQHVIDSIFIGDNLVPATFIDAVQSHEISLEAERFKNTERMEWNIEQKRYIEFKSDWIADTAQIAYMDTLDSLSYSAIIETIPEVGQVFVDRNVWVEKDISPEPTKKYYFDTTFVFPHWKFAGDDSIMWTINTDCNDNGIVDAAEITYDEIDNASECIEDGASWDDDDNVCFQDVGNGLFDPLEPWWDVDSSGTYNSNEPFEDRNCNGIHDIAEPRASNVSDCEEGNYIVDDEGGFCDLGNGKWDDNEEYTVVDGGDTMLFKMSDRPLRLLFSYPEDGSDPVGMPTIEPGDSLRTRHGLVFHKLIVDIEKEDFQSVQKDNIDSVLTLYTNRQFDRLEGNLIGDSEYYVTKAEYVQDGEQEYDYHLFKTDVHTYKLSLPSYFYPYGYHGFSFNFDGSVTFSPENYVDGFWQEGFSKDEIMFYSYNGLIRDGERVVDSYYDTTSIGTYYMEKSYSVDADEVTVPAKKIKGYEEDGTKFCFTDTTIEISNFEECPPSDTTFNNCFRITRETTMTMVGSGLEYGEKNITWLAKNHGIVKDELWVRWSEPQGLESEFWIGISKLELGTFSVSVQPSNDRLLSRLINQQKTLKLSDFGQTEELNYEPFKINRTAGLHRVRLPFDYLTNW